ncbi:MAG: hypothetical protein JNM72_13915 [Deltaproteobacteria bacterium]|jgi:hypothetical protein|nr:hypothetical protein [Deltaproteobacteria bacterium]
MNLPRAAAAALIWAPGLAWAGFGDLTTVSSYSSGDAVVDIQAEPEGRYLAVLYGGDDPKVAVFDTWSWAFIEFVSGSEDPCADADPKSLTAWSADRRFFVGCSNGTIGDLRLQDGFYTRGSLSVSVGADAVLFVRAIDQQLVAVTATGSAVVATPFSASTGETSTAWSIASAQTPVSAAGATGGIVLLMGNNLVSGFSASGGTLTVTTAPAGTYAEVMATGPNTFLIAGGEAGLLRYAVGNTTLLGASAGSFESLVSLGLWDGDLVVADQGRGQLGLLPLGDGGVPEDGVDLWLDIEEDESSVRAVSGVDGYLVLGTSAGAVRVKSDRPWVEVGTAAPAAGVSGTEVELSFVAEVAVDWELRVGGDTLSGGSLLGSGSAAAGETVTSSFVLDDRFDEGVNLVRALVTDRDGLVGRGGAYVQKDDPPGQVSLSQNSVRVDHETLRLVFDALPDADIESYAVFLSDESFTAADYAGCEPGTSASPCGPSARVDGEKGVRIVPAESSQDRVTVSILGLTNGKEYHMAVRAYDASGQEGPMSKVVNGVPAAGKGPAELSGEDGGLCGTSAPATALGALAALGLGLGRRRRQVLGAAAGLVLLAGAPVDAWAQAQSKAETTGHIQVSYGNVELEDTAITGVYGTSGNGVTMLEWGPQIIKQVELTGGLGWFRENGKGLLDDETRTDGKIVFRAIPLTLNAKVRLDFFKDQILVPFGAAGLDAWSFKQDPYKGDQVLTGWKYGWHWNAGGQLLLDKLDPRTASRFQAVSGVDNTFLVVEFRKQDIGSGDEGLYFTGQSLNFGLQFDY